MAHTQGGIPTYKRRKGGIYRAIHHPEVYPGYEALGSLSTTVVTRVMKLSGASLPPLFPGYEVLGSLPFSVIPRL